MVIILQRQNQSRDLEDKGQYPLGDFGVISAKNDRRRPILMPTLSPMTLWVWRIDWPTG